VPTHSGYKWLVTADVESLAWDPHTEHSFVVCALASKDGHFSVLNYIFFFGFGVY
jgi:hypothetical protein